MELFPQSPTFLLLTVLLKNEGKILVIILLKFRSSGAFIKSATVHHIVSSSHPQDMLYFGDTKDFIYMILAGEGLSRLGPNGRLGSLEQIKVYRFTVRENRFWRFGQ